MRSRAVFVDRVVLGEFPRRGHRPPIDAQLRGRVTPGILELFNGGSWHVHRVGQAAYVHTDRHHWILGVWPHGTPAPAWSARLGLESAGYRRRVERCAHEQHGRRFLRDASGRFLAPLPWWRTPGPRLYRWLEPAPSMFELERGYR